MIDRWLIWFDLIFLITIILLFLSIILLRLTLDRHIRKHLPLDKVYNSPLDWYGGLMRTMGFGYAAVFDRINNVGMKEYYDGVNVKNIANPFEKFISYVFVISFAYFLFSIVLYSITSYFDIV